MKVLMLHIQPYINKSTTSINPRTAGGMPACQYEIREFIMKQISVIIIIIRLSTKPIMAM